ncbi:MAG: polysaccharide deacetylase family protein [Gordonibacter sp.]|uniref:polysaccharide deacetylase family protein n=1 Tax=Gordonibacter sp. TaxID=1968902 RepID=UPI002FC740A0
MSLPRLRLPSCVALLFCSLFLAATLSGCASPASSSPDNAPAPKSDVEALRDAGVVKEPEHQQDNDAAAAATKKEPATSDKQGASEQVQKRVDAALAKGRDAEQRIANGDASAKVCYLTFDDGPSDNTHDILRILDEKDALATFFVQGNSEKIDLVKDIADKGHAIGLHTYSHDYAQLYANDNAYYADLAAVQDAVSSRIGHTVDIVRFPGGTSNTVSKQYSTGIMSRLSQSVPASGYQYFDWNLSGGDSSSPPPPAADIANNVLLNIGSQQRVCVLMHDTTVKRTTVEALPAIIDGLRAQGYVFGLLERSIPPFHHAANN